MSGRPIKILLAVLASIAAVFLVLFAAFPGIPAYIKVKAQYSHIDSLTEDFEICTVPAEFSKENLKGLLVRVPDGYELSETGSSLSERSGDGKIIVMDTSLSGIDPAKYIEDYDPWEGYKYGEKEYRSFFSKMGREYIDPTASGNKFLWYVRGELRSKDCLKLRGDALRVFMEMAEIKESAFGMENTWDLKGSGYSAVVANGSAEIFKNAEYWTVTLYPDDQPGKNFYMMLRNIPDDTVKQIISSIELDKNRS